MNKGTSNSVMASYVQKALARNDKEQKTPRSEAKPSYKPKASNRKCQTTEQSTKNIEEQNSKEDLGISLANSISNQPKAFNLKHEVIADIECKLPRKEILFDKASRRQVLNRAVIKVTAKVIKELGNISYPPQSVINVMIAYVCALIPYDDCKILNVGHKVYPNCTQPLKNGEYMHKLTLKIVETIETASEEYKQKLQKIREKYLVGWDMKPTAFSDKYSSARLILTYLHTLCSYANNNWNNDIFTYKEFTVEKVKMKEGKLDTKFERAHSEGRIGKVWEKSSEYRKAKDKSLYITPPKNELTTTYNSTRTDLRKVHDDMIYNLLKVINLLITIEAEK